MVTRVWPEWLSRKVTTNAPLNSIGDTLHRLGDPAAASVYREALATALAVQVLPQALDALAGLAAFAHQAGDPEQALLLASWVATHPHASPQAKARASQLQQTLAAQLSYEQAEAIRAKSAGQSFDQWLGTTAKHLQYEPWHPEGTRTP